MADFCTNEEHARCSVLIRSANDAIICSTEKDRIAIWNEAATRIFGYREDEALGQPVEMLIPERLKQAHRDGVLRFLSSGESRIVGKTVEIEGLRKDGRIFPLELTISTWDKDGGPCFSAIIRDITERKLMEKELIAAKIAAENANRAKSKFLSSMSHELRTPMNAILGFAQMLKFNPKEPLTEAQKKCVSYILKGGHHLLELINDILDLAKIEAGKVELFIEDISPTDVLDECLSLVRAAAEERGITISGPGMTADVPKIRADRTRLKQALLNLLSNAVKYNRKHGTITVNIERAPDNRLRITVTDTGEGIPEDRQHELFKPFNRLDARNMDVEGSGIGLVVCKDLIELMHGEIDLRSDVGKGTTFSIELPRADKEDDRSDAPRDIVDSPSPGVSATLLYVEDNSDNLDLMRLIVSRIEGLSLISANSAEQGIELTMSEKPDLIILNDNLPGMNSLEVLNELRDGQGGSGIPVLALSESPSQRDIEKGMEAGFLRYLTKPIQVLDLVEAINDILMASR